MQKDKSLGMTTVEYDITVAKLRSRVYGLLADGFRQVDEKQSEFLLSEYISTWQKLLELIEGGEKFYPLIERLEKALISQGYAGLLEEYTEFFEPHGKLLAPPYETEYTMETPQHALTQQVQFADISGFYKAFGLEISEEMPDRVDHITTELEFMHVLAYKESVAIEDNETEHIEIVQDTECKFMNDHLIRWTGKFKDRLAQADCGKFYNILGEVLDLWVNFDKAYLFSRNEQES